MKKKCFMLIILSISLLLMADALHERCEKESCFTGKITDTQVLMICRFKSKLSNLMISNPLGFIQVNCVVDNNKELCYSIPGIKKEFNSERNEVVLTLERSQFIPEGTWVCRDDTERLTMNLSMSRGILHSMDIGLKISFRRKHNFYIFTLDCLSCWRPFGDFVEFKMNGKSLNELRRSTNGVCYHTQVLCTPNICTCCNNSNRYSLVHRLMDLTTIESFGCKMRFHDTYMSSEKIIELDHPFHLESYVGIGTEDPVYETEVWSSSNQEPPGETEYTIRQSTDNPADKSTVKTNHKSGKSDVIINRACALVIVTAMVAHL